MTTEERSRKKEQPNILLLWGDDLAMWNISAYHPGMMSGSTPNIDRMANEGEPRLAVRTRQSPSAWFLKTFDDFSPRKEPGLNIDDMMEALNPTQCR